MNIVNNLNSCLYIIFILHILIQNSFQQRNSHHIHVGKFLDSIDVEIDKIVDVSLLQLLNAYHNGNYCPFKKKVVSKMVEGEDIIIDVIGGSVTWGAELQNRAGIYIYFI
jgi:hypothetical protein